MTNSSRIDFRFGGGHIDILLDLVSGNVERYHGDSRDFPYYKDGERVSDANGIHSRLGGKQYYQSRSGMSGAGWVPAKPTLKKLGTYRVDVGGILLGFSSEREFAPHVGDFEIFAPFAYRGGDVGKNPVVVRERDGKITLLAEWQVAPFLRGEVETEPRTYEFTYLKDVNSGEEKLVATIHQPKDHYDRGDTRATRILVEGFHHTTLDFVFPEGWQPEGDEQFWRRLGFRRIPMAGRADGLYKVVRNICRYMVDEWDDHAEIQKWVPANVHVLAPHMYIQERDGQYVGVARFLIEGSWYDFEAYLDNARAFRIFAGDREEIEKLEQELEAGAREKNAQEVADRLRQEQQAKEILERDEKFRALVEKHGELALAIEDSLAAGNCRPGTDDFVNRFFRGRTSATVKEVSRFVSIWGVRRVLEHKLLPLANNEKPNS